MFDTTGRSDDDDGGSDESDDNDDERLNNEFHKLGNVDTAAPALVCAHNTGYSRNSDGGAFIVYDYMTG